MNACAHVCSMNLCVNYTLSFLLFWGVGVTGKTTRAYCILKGNRLKMWWGHDVRDEHMDPPNKVVLMDDKCVDAVQVCVWDICLCINMCVCVYVYIYTCLYTYVRVYIHAHMLYCADGWQVRGCCAGVCV